MKLKEGNSQLFNYDFFLAPLHVSSAQKVPSVSCRLPKYVTLVFPRILALGICQQTPTLSHTWRYILLLKPHFWT